MITGFLLGCGLNYSFDQNTALGGIDWVWVSFAERLNMTAVALGTLIGDLLGIQTWRFQERALT